MTSVYVNDAEEDWVCDRLAREWRIAHGFAQRDAKILWLLAGWKWNDFSLRNDTSFYMNRSAVVVTVHHIDDDKFDAQNFAMRDTLVTAYHVPCERTRTQVARHTSKPIHVIPFWVNDELWRVREADICQTLGTECIHGDRYVVGSFQRDTEGVGLPAVVTPKLSKGPDIFCDVVEHIAKTQPVHVFLAGWRRQYVMQRLDAAGIPYTYFDRPDFETINTLYNSLDLYVVGSRVEGGPQALVECAASMTPIISTRVGFAEDIVGDALFDGSDMTTVDAAIDAVDTSANFLRVKSRFISEGGMKPFEDFFNSL